MMPVGEMPERLMLNTEACLLICRKRYGYHERAVSYLMKDVRRQKNFC